MAGNRDRLFQKALREYGPMLSRIASAYEFDPDLRQDLVQDIALALWQALPKFEGRASLKTFAARIAHYRGVDHVTRERKKPRTTTKMPDIPEPGPGLEDKAHRKIQRQRLIKAVQKLPMKLRQVATLALEGFEAREIADALGISPNNASVRLGRAKQALKEELGV